MERQRALLVTTRPGENHGLDELNVALKRGWRVACATAMGGAGIGTQNGKPDLCFAALVIIERRDDAEHQAYATEASAGAPLEAASDAPPVDIDLEDDLLKNQGV